MSTQTESIQTKTFASTLAPSNHRIEAYWIIYEQENQTNSSQFLIQKASTPNQHDRKGEGEYSAETQANHPSTGEQKSCQKQSMVIKLLQNISQQYATYTFLNFHHCQINTSTIQQIIEQMEKQFLTYKLTKRNLVCGILIPSVSNNIINQITSSPYFYKIIKFYKLYQSSQSIQKPISPENSPTRKMKMSRKASIIVGSNLFIDVGRPEEEIKLQLIKQMKLDFIWVGVISKLGTDVQNFQSIMIQEEDFTPEYIGFEQMFFTELNSLIFTQNDKKTSIPESRLIEFLQGASKKALGQLSISTSIEELIRSKFNSRVIISDIVAVQDYLPLLLSRNYFNLLYIQSSTLMRYKQFKEECSQRYEMLFNILDLQTFLIIDDYWYRRFLLKSMPHVKFIIDRSNSNVSYEEVIDKNYKQIIPSYRPSFDEYFLSICNILKQRSGCLKQAVGSIIVKDKRIIATGYNGTPIDCINCFNGGCKVCNNSEKMNTEVLSCSCIHAQYGCILEAGIKITPGSTLYSTKLPCLWCCKLIVQGRISKIVYLKSKYSHLQYENNQLARQILDKANIQLVEVQQSKIFISV